MDDAKRDSGGWRVGRSILTELQHMLFWNLLSSQGQLSAPRVRAFVASLPPGWVSELRAIVGPVEGADLPLEHLALVTGTLLSDSYSEATLPLRDLTLERAVELVEGHLPAQTRADGALPLLERWVANGVRMVELAYAQAGYDEAQPGLLARRARQGFEHIVPFLRDGARHSQFWHWLDRFYYDRYQRWRAEQAEMMAAQEEQAIAHLGAAMGNEPPRLDWLPPVNPLRHRALLAEAVAAGRLQVLFWAQPFELVDSMGIFPGQVLVSFAPPGEGYDSFRAFSEDVAGRLKALSDPTRLLILRMIRAFSMDNTEMAQMLDLARPTVSVHAKLLREAGLIRTERVGRQALHEIDGQALRALFRDLESLLDLPPEA